MRFSNLQLNPAPCMLLVNSHDSLILFLFLHVDVINYYLQPNIKTSICKPV